MAGRPRCIWSTCVCVCARKLTYGLSSCIHVHLNPHTHIHTHTRRRTDVCSSGAEKCMPVWICVFPTKNILIWVICVSPCYPGVCEPPLSRCVRVWPAVQTLLRPWNRVQAHFQKTSEYLQRKDVTSIELLRAKIKDHLWFDESNGVTHLAVTIFGGEVQSGSPCPWISSARRPGWSSKAERSGDFRERSLGSERDFLKYRFGKKGDIEKEMKGWSELFVL